MRIALKHPLVKFVAVNTVLGVIAVYARAFHRNIPYGVVDFFISIPVMFLMSAIPLVFHFTRYQVHYDERIKWWPKKYPPVEESSGIMGEIVAYIFSIALFLFFFIMTARWIFG